MISDHYRREYIMYILTFYIMYNPQMSYPQYTDVKIK